MPQLQNLVLKDRAATPVDHTFTPRDIVNGLGTVVETTGVPLGEKRFQIALNRTASGRYKAVIKMALPVVADQTINGVVTPTIVRTSFIDCTFTFDSGSSEQERKDAVGMFMSAFDPTKVLVNDTIVKLQGVY